MRSAAVWAYVVAAGIVGLLWSVARAVIAPGISAELGGAVAIASGAIWVLAGAAFHLRHADAWSRHRAVAIGLAFAAAAGILTPIRIVALSYGWLPAAVGSPTLLQWSIALGVLAAVPQVLSLVLLWIGIRRERVHPDRRLVWVARVAIWLAVGSLLVGSARSVIPALAGYHSDQLLYFGWTVISSVAQSLLAAGLTAEIVAGAVSGERPRSAWVVGAGARAVVLVATLMYPFFANEIAQLAGSLGLFLLVQQVVGLIAALGFFAAFALGLPSDDSPAIPVAPVSPHLPDGSTLDLSEGGRDA